MKIKCTKTTEQFIEDAHKVHGDKYDYSKVNYINNKIKVVIICPKHGEFTQTPNKHLLGRGCPKCKNEQTSLRFRDTTEIFISKSIRRHGNFYDYSKVEYIKDNIPVLIGCPKHGWFYQTPESHRQNGCYHCGRERTINSQKITKEKFIHDCNILFNNKYDYSLVKFGNLNDKIQIICPIHGKFLQRAIAHRNGQECPKCNLKSQGKLLLKLQKEFPEEIFTWEYKSEWLKGQRIDICLEKYKIAIEYDGEQHFKSIAKFGGEFGLNYRQKQDKLKEEKCKMNEYKLFRVRYNHIKEDVDNLIVNIKMIIDNYYAN